MEAGQFCHYTAVVIEDGSQCHHESLVADLWSPDCSMSTQSLMGLLPLCMTSCLCKQQFDKELFSQEPPLPLATGQDGQPFFPLWQSTLPYKTSKTLSQSSSSMQPNTELESYPTMGTKKRSEAVLVSRDANIEAVGSECQRKREVVSLTNEMHEMECLRWNSVVLAHSQLDGCAGGAADEVLGGVRDKLQSYGWRQSLSEVST